MKKVSVRTMWQGRFVSVRESEIEEAKRRGGLEIAHKDDVMEILPDQLEELKPNPRVYQCKFTKGKTYRLVDILFKPKDTRQAELF